MVFPIFHTFSTTSLDSSRTFYRFFHSLMFEIEDWVIELKFELACWLDKSKENCGALSLIFMLWSNTFLIALHSFNNNLTILFLVSWKTLPSLCFYLKNTSLLSPWIWHVLLIFLKYTHKIFIFYIDDIYIRHV